MERERKTDKRMDAADVLLEGITYSDLFRIIDKRCNEINERTVAHIAKEILREREDAFLLLLEDNMQEIVERARRRRKIRNQVIHLKRTHKQE